MDVTGIVTATVIPTVAEVDRSIGNNDKILQ